MNPKKHWTEYAALAEHYKSIGQTEIGLYGSDPAEMPWHLVTEVKGGGSHRLDMDTSVWAMAHHHESGLTFRLSLDLEKPGANGSGEYHLDVETIREVFSRISPEGARQMRDYLMAAAASVEERGQQYQEAAHRQNADAKALTAIAEQGVALAGV